MAFEPWVGVTTCNLYTSDPLRLVNTPDLPAYDFDVPCKTRKPRENEVAPIRPLTVVPVSLVVELPTGTVVHDSYTPSGRSLGYRPTMVEVPPDSGNYYIVQWSEIAARGYINEHLLCFCHKRVFTPILE